MNTKTEPNMRYSITEWLIHGGEKTFRECLPDRSNGLLIQAASSQDRIGGRNFICGKISPQWSAVQNNYKQQFQTKYDKQQFHSTIYSSQLIRHISLFGKSLWNFRNDILHNATVTKEAKKQRRDCKTRIVEQIEIGTDGLSATERYLIDQVSLDNLLELIINKQKQWIRHVELARQRFDDEYSDQYDNLRENLRDWLTDPKEIDRANSTTIVQTQNCDSHLGINNHNSSDISINSVLTPITP